VSVNKTVIVTGAARGIGRAIADRFVKAGASVYVLDIDVPDKAATGDVPQPIFCKGDVSCTGDVKTFIEQVMTESGNVDVVVNNAGILRDNVIWRMPEADFDAVLTVNLKGPWIMSKEVAQVMRKQKSGRIINIASRAWLGNFGQSNYSAAKAGLISLTRVLALELARSNVTVNAVAPGLIDTPMTKGLPADVYERLVNMQPSKKAGTPEDIAAVVEFLAGDEAGFITGQVIHVDGGRSIGATVL
jgi:NAD(P)-dependent dehydrogenase (short-subunit alcohol dehydrogenase family)